MFSHSPRFVVFTSTSALVAIVVYFERSDNFANFVNSKLYLFLCLTASNISMAALTLTFSESMRPSMGMRIWASAA